MQVKVGLGLKRSRAVTFTLGGRRGTQKSTIRRCDQETVSLPCQLDPGGLL